MCKHVVAVLLSVTVMPSTAPGAERSTFHTGPTDKAARRSAALLRDIDDRTSCATLPRPIVRVRLSVVSDVIRDQAAIIREMAGAIWAAEGVTLEWLAEGEAPTWAGVDLWLVAQDEPVDQSRRGTALGAASFVRGIPRPIIRLSVGAAVSWVRQALLRKFQMVAPLGGTFSLRLNDARTQVARALGYAAAHEVGHVLLSTREHARDGLMKIEYTSLDRLDSDPSATRLDRRNRERLAAALARTAGCAASRP